MIFWDVGHRTVPQAFLYCTTCPVVMYHIFCGIIPCAIVVNSFSTQKFKYYLRMFITGLYHRFCDTCSTEVALPVVLQGHTI